MYGHATHGPPAVWWEHSAKPIEPLASFASSLRPTRNVRWVSCQHSLLSGSCSIQVGISWISSVTILCTRARYPKTVRVRFHARRWSGSPRAKTFYLLSHQPSANHSGQGIGQLYMKEPFSLGDCEQKIQKVLDAGGPSLSARSASWFHRRQPQSVHLTRLGGSCASQFGFFDKISVVAALLQAPMVSGRRRHLLWRCHSFGTLFAYGLRASSPQQGTGSLFLLWLRGSVHCVHVQGHPEV